MDGKESLFRHGTAPVDMIALHFVPRDIKLHTKLHSGIRNEENQAAHTYANQLQFIDTYISNYRIVLFAADGK